MSLIHRVSGLSTALLASAASTFCVLAVAVCNFAEINAQPGSLIQSASGEELMAVTADLGIFCEDVFHDESDNMMHLSRVFFYFSISLGGLAVVLSWAISTVLPPTDFTWTLISALAAATAVLQVPIFIIYGSEPCSGKVLVQTCTMSLGSYYLIGSTTMWVVVTLCTQCMDPPTWAEELAFWRIPKNMESVLVGTDEELGGFPPNSPASKLEDARKNRVEKESKRSDWTLPAVSTESMKDDEFDWSSPRLEGSPQTVDRSHETVPLGNKNSVPLDVDKTWLHERAISISLDTEESWLYERAKKSAPLSPDANNLLGSHVLGSVQSPAKEKIRIVSHVDVGVPERSPISSNSPRSPGRVSQSGSQLSRMSGSRTGPATSADILADLQAEVKKYSDKTPLTRHDKGPLDSFSLGLRALTGKLTRDARRKRHRRMPRRNDYFELDDDGDFSDDEPFMSPPIEVNIQPFADFENADVFSDDEDELMNDWEALHRATSAGVRLGLQEGYSDEGEWIEFDSPIQGYHSDPEPACYSSDSSRSHASPSNLKVSSSPFNKKGEDSSTISGLTSDSKKSRKRRGRRMRRSNSPNVTVVSGGGSLLDVTIDEETDQDVLKEIHGEESILGAYSLQRALSEPLPPYRSENLTPQRHRQHLETISLNPSTLSERMGIATMDFSSPNASTFRTQLAEPQDSVAETNALLSLPRLEQDRPSLTVIDSPVPQKPIPSSPKAISSMSSRPPVPRPVPARSFSLSPRRNRTLKLETWKTDARSLGGINARRATKFEDDCSSQSSEGSERSKSSTRAREFRIERIKRMKEAKKRLTQNNSSAFNRRQASAHARIRKAHTDIIHQSDHSDHSDDTDVIHGSEPTNKSFRDDRIKDADSSAESAYVPTTTSRSYGYQQSNKSYLEGRIAEVPDTKTSAAVSNAKASVAVPDANTSAETPDATMTAKSANISGTTSRWYGSELSNKSYRDGSFAVVSDASESEESTSESDAKSRSYRSEPRNKSYRDSKTVVTSKPESTSSRSHPDRRTILSDLLRDAQSKPLDPDGGAPDGDSSPDDFADLDYGPTSKYLPKFSVNLGEDLEHDLEPGLTPSPAMHRQNTKKSPEVSTIFQDSAEQVVKGVADDSAIEDYSKEHPTLTTVNDSTMISYESNEVDEFPVDTDIASMTGIENVASGKQEFVVAENLDSKYGSFAMDELDLQLISVLRPLGKEYGNDEESL